MSNIARLRMFGGLLLVAGIAAASLIPVGLEIRTGLHWLIEHFLIYAAATALFCVIWPRPWQVAAAFMAMAGVLEALHGLTADRTPDLPTAISGGRDRGCPDCTSRHFRLRAPADRRRLAR